MHSPPRAASTSFSKLEYAGRNIQFSKKQLFWDPILAGHSEKCHKEKTWSLWRFSGHLSPFCVHWLINCVALGAPRFPWSYIESLVLPQVVHRLPQFQSCSNSLVQYSGNVHFHGSTRTLKIQWPSSLWDSWSHRPAIRFSRALRTRVNSCHPNPAQISKHLLVAAHLPYSMSFLLLPGRLSLLSSNLLLV